MAGTREGAQEILKMWSTKARGPVAMPQLPHRLMRHCMDGLYTYYFIIARASRDAVPAYTMPVSVHL